MWNEVSVKVGLNLNIKTRSEHVRCIIIKAVWHQVSPNYKKQRKAHHLCCTITYLDHCLYF